MKLPISFPFGGVDENDAFSTQAPNTSRRIMNMRGIDPVTGRVRGATRAGTSVAVSGHAQISGGTAKVLAIDQITYSNNALDFSAPETGSPPVMPTTQVDWSAKNATGRSCIASQYDSQNNLYELDEKNTVTKFNSKGAIVLTFGVPVADPQHICRAFFIDDVGGIYIGVSAGGESDTARVFKFLQTPDLSKYVIGNVPDNIAVMMPDAPWLQPGGYIARIKVADSVMYCGVDFPKTGRSFLIAYNNLDTGVPTEVWRTATPYPCKGVCVSPGKGICTASPLNTTRGTNPQDPNVGFVTDQGIWTPLNLTSASTRIWGWWDAERIDGGAFRTDTYIQDETIPVWADLSGNGRDLIADYIWDYAGGTGNTDKNVGGTYNLKGLAGKPTVRFAGGREQAGDGNNQAMLSLPNPGVQPNQKDQQRSMVPGYTSGLWLIAIVFRSQLNSTGGKAASQAVFGQQVTTPATTWRGLVVNGDETDVGSGADGSANINTAAGNVAVFDDASVAGAVEHILGNMDTGADVITGGPVLAVWICDGNTSTAAVPTTGDGETRSLLRVNGTHYGRWRSANAIVCKVQTMLAGRQGVADLYAAGGAGPGSAGNCTEFFEGDIAEIVVLRDFQGTEPKVISHPAGAYTGEADAGAGNYVPTTHTNGTATDIEKLEGYLAHKWGIYGRLPAFHPYNTVAPLPSATSPDVNVLNTTNGIAALFRPADGALLAYYPSADYVGLDIETATPSIYESDANTYFWTCANDQTIAISTINKLVYVPGTFLMSNTVGATITVAFSDYVDIDVDYYGNAYVPMRPSTNALPSLVVYDPTATEIFRFFTVASGNNGNQRAFTCAAVKTKNDDAADDLTNDRGEFCALGMIYTDIAGAVSTNQVKQIRTYASTPNTNRPRIQVNVAVSGGYFKRWNSAGYTSPAGSGTLTNPIFDTAALYVTLIPAYGHIWGIDGKSARKFNPKTDVVSEWKATSAGELPPRPRLGCLWNGRAVLARSEDAPQEWYMSRQGDFENWDYFPPVFASDSAVASTTAKAAGKVPDIINALIPYNDDLLIFGCDSAIYRLTGNPAQGGSIDLVSDVTGIAFGSSWCKDPEGVIYFFGSRGGVWAMAPGGQPVSISRLKIERSLANVNLSTHRVIMEWSDEEDGLRVYFVAWSTATVIKDWFWERKTNAWFPDRYDSTAIQPTAIKVIDGDAAGDRYTVIGREDGRLVKVDRTAKSDISTTSSTYVAIDSHFMAGPIVPDASALDVNYRNFRATLSPSQDGAQYRLIAAKTPEPPVFAGAVTYGPLVYASGDFNPEPVMWHSGDGQLKAGVNPISLKRMRGTYCFVLVGNSLVNKRFAWEIGEIEAEVADEVRV